MNKNENFSALEKAVAAWGEMMPKWIKTLAVECDKSSQGKVSSRLRYSKATISLVLRNEYTGDLTAVKEQVNNVLMNASHDCPVFGTILIRDCQLNQLQPFSSSGNPNKIRLFRACRNCQHHRSKEN